MLRYFRILEDRAAELGNHRRKHVYAIERHGRDLRDRLEAIGRFDRVHLRQPATDLAGEMDAVLEAGRTETEKLSLLGCYYAIQFLHLNIRSIDFLRSSVRRGHDNTEACREFLRRAQDDFGALVKEYMTRLLDLFLADVPDLEFVVCTVGTRLHQDDVDLGIIDDGGPGRTELNRAIGKLAQQMTRWSSIPDFYLSEHIGGSGYSVSIEEYRARLDRKILDFVSASELLSAYPIVGSTRLFEKFKRKVLSRYYYRRRGPNREHEGYLRGLVGEIESFLLWPRDPHTIRPKDDLLRPLSALLWAYRTVYGIRKTDAWETFHQLGTVLSKKRHLFEDLERHYTFVETFRHLYQQFTAQKETIDLSDPKELEALESVALTLGYADQGVISSWQRLLVHYFEHVRAGREIVDELVPAIRDHMRKISVLDGWLQRLATSRDEPESRGLAVEFLFRVRYFRGIKYWHDILDELEDPENELITPLVRELMAVTPDKRTRILKRYASWGYQTFFTMLRLLIIFGDHGRKHRTPEIFEALNKAFLETIGGTPDETRRFATVFVYFPALVYRYLKAIGDQEIRLLRDKFSGPVWDPEAVAWKNQLLRFLDIYTTSSRFFRRVLDRVCQRRPECLLYLDDRDRIDRKARGIFAEIPRLRTHLEQRFELATYHDLQLLRFGLDTIEGVPLSQLDAQFTEFSDQYLQILFDVCKAEQDAVSQVRILTYDLLGIFVAGGHARERAHQDDYDLIVLLNSDSEEMVEYCGRILSRVNREIAQRGIIPQYRMGDVVGRYVTRFGELEGFLRRHGSDAFIEMSQLLGARLVVGSRRLEAEFRRRIIEGCVYSHRRDYLEALIEEVRSRREYQERGCVSFHCDVKERQGGLRDIELAMLAWKMIRKCAEPLGPRLLLKLAEEMPQYRELFHDLLRSYQLLNRLRDVYRLTVGPSDSLDPERLETPANLLGYRPRAAMSAAAFLRQDCERHCEQSAKAVDALLKLAIRD